MEKDEINTSWAKITYSKINHTAADMAQFDLARIRLFWNRTQEVFKDPMIGPPGTTNLRDFLDKNKPLSKGLLSNPIFDTCGEPCWYVAEGSIVALASLITQRECNPAAFAQMRPKLSDWNHTIDSLHRCGRILGTAMRLKGYSLKDVILLMGKNKEAEADDTPDQICLA